MLTAEPETSPPPVSDELAAYRDRLFGRPIEEARSTLRERAADYGELSRMVDELIMPSDEPRDVEDSLGTIRARAEAAVLAIAEARFGLAMTSSLGIDGEGLAELRAFLAELGDHFALYVGPLTRSRVCRVAIPHLLFPGLEGCVEELARERPWSWGTD